jgi:hypothetical protein
MHFRHAILLHMPAVSGRVVKGKVVTRARLREGARVVVLVEDRGPPVDLDPDEEAGVLKGIQEFKDGKSMPISRLRTKLRRHFRQQ